MKLAVFVVCASMFGALAALAQPAQLGPAAPTPAPSAGAPPLDLNSRALPLGGAMPDAALWRDYVARFVTADGRVVDTANKDISHSEGQGYGMLLAVAYNDRATFNRIWSWTRGNLMVRGDSLLAWRWNPSSRPAVSDINDAADGDLLVAWALAEAGAYWSDDAYSVEARRIASDIGRKLIVQTSGGPAVLLPGVAGFSPAPGDTTLNLSYWVFPALERLNLVAPEFDWSGLSQGGLELIESARFGAAALPTDWISYSDKTLRPAPGFSPTFSYNAIRIPLYMAWAGVGGRTAYQPFAAWARTDAAPPIVNVATGAAADWLAEPGYRAIGALVRCVVYGTRFPVDLQESEIDENYYPATLRLLALTAARMRFPTCLGD